MKIWVKVDVPKGKYCYPDDGKTCCQYYGVVNGETYCLLFCEEISETDNKRDLKLPQCQKAGEGRICLNCGHWADSWCELKNEAKLTSDICDEFQYGDWK